MAEHRVPAAVAHQVIHGYSEGHQLLASSCDLDHHAADTLGHNSDSAPRSRASDGPYVTGYPLGDIGYVVARTWADAEAARPNTVLTRSLIVPRSRVSQIDPGRLLERLTKPAVDETQGVAPIEIDELVGPPAGLSSGEAQIACGYYFASDPLVAEPWDTRDRIALAIWRQLWLSGSMGLHFCTAPDTTRFSRMDRPLLFAGNGQASGLNHAPEPAAMHTLQADLAYPGPFRAFAHFVGSGERAAGLMIAFAETYEMLGSPAGAASEFGELLARYRADDPRRLRRLKRRVLGFHGKVPWWSVEPFDLLEALAHGDLGRCIFASDASLDRWLREWWSRDPPRTAAALVSQPVAPATPLGPATACEGLANAFASAASVLITPETLDVAIEVDHEEALRAIWDRNDPELWRAWSRLADSIDVPRSPDYDGKGYDWTSAVGAVRSDSQALSRVLRRYPEALDYLIALADSDPMASDLHVQLSREAKHYIRERLNDSRDLLSGLARLADDAELPRSFDSPSWLRVLRQSDDDVVHAVAYLISMADYSKYWEVNALAFVKLYKRLAKPGGDEAWTRLTPHLRGDRHSWDRCARLVQDFAGRFKSLKPEDQRPVVELIAKADGRAARALAECAREATDDKRKSKKFNFLDPSTWW